MAERSRRWRQRDVTPPRRHRRDRTRVYAPREGTETVFNQHRPLLRGPGRRVAAGGPFIRTSKLWRGLSSSGTPRTVRRRLERVAHFEERKSPLRASDASRTISRASNSIFIRRRRHGLVRGARGSGSFGAGRLPQRRLGADGFGHCRSPCGNLQVVLQFGVSRGRSEVLLALRGRGYLSEIVSKFEPKTWPPCRDSETRPLSLGEKRGTRRVDGVEGSTTLSDAVDAKIT